MKFIRLISQKFFILKEAYFCGYIQIEDSYMIVEKLEYDYVLLLTYYFLSIRPSYFHNLFRQFSAKIIQ